MKRLAHRLVGVFCLSFAAIAAIHQAATPAPAQVSDFRAGYQVIGDLCIYALPNGDVYWRTFQTNQPWNTPPLYKGNFFVGAAPSDFQTSYRVVAPAGSGSPAIIYSSPTGDFYWRSLQTNVTWSGPPLNQGNYFGNGAAPADFQASYEVMGSFVVHALPNGDYYWRTFQTNSPWTGGPIYQGNYFGEVPLPASSSSLGRIKSNYAPKTRP